MASDRRLPACAGIVLLVAVLVTCLVLGLGLTTGVGR